MIKRRHSQIKENKIMHHKTQPKEEEIQSKKKQAKLTSFVNHKKK